MDHATSDAERTSKEASARRSPSHREIIRGTSVPLNPEDRLVGPD